MRLGKINYKKVISWFLIFAIIFTGINWPNFVSKADVTNQLGVSQFDADQNFPYMMMVYIKNKDDSANNSTIYAVKTNAELYYMNDYDLIVTDEGVSIDSYYYMWNADTNSWEATYTFETTFDSDLNRYKLFNNGSSETKFSYITKADFSKDSFNLNDLDNGNYILGYDSLVEGTTLRNVNYLKYSQTDNPVFGTVSSASTFLLKNMFIDKEIIKNTKVAHTNASSDDDSLDYENIKIGDIITFPNVISDIEIKDNIQDSDDVSTMTVDYEISNIYSLQEDSENDSKDVKPIDKEDWDEYASITNGSLTMGVYDEDDWNDSSFIIEISAIVTPSFVAGIDNKVHKFILKVNNLTGEDKELLDSAYSELINSDDYKSRLLASTNLISSDEDNEYISDITVFGKDESIDSLNKDSKNINIFKIYTSFANGYFDDSVYNLDKVSNIKNNLSFDISGKNFDGSDISDYAKVVFDEKTNNYNLIVDADKITEYRRDNRDKEAFSELVITANYNDEYETRFTVNLSVVQYLNGNYMPDDEIIDVSDIDFGTALTSSYGPIPHVLKSGMDFDETYQTLVNYSDYQLLIYSSDLPALDNSGNLTFTKDTVDFEIYKNTDGEWEFYNIMTNVSNATINLPEKASYMAIEFLNYDLINKITGKSVLSKNTIDSNYNMTLRSSKLPSKYLGGGSDNIFNTSDGYNNYYVFRKGQSTYFMIKSKTKAIDNGYSISFNGSITSNDTSSNGVKYYMLVQNIWVECNSSVVSNNGYNITYLADFNKYICYTNDVNYGTPIDTDMIGSVDYFKYIPTFVSLNGYDYVIANVNNELMAIEYKGADLIIDEGRLKFTNQTSSFDIQFTRYEDFAWTTPSQSIDSIDSNGYYNINDFSGGIIYSNKNIKGTDGSVLFDVNYACSSIVTSELQESTYPITRPNIDDFTLAEDDTTITIPGTPNVNDPDADVEDVTLNISLDDYSSSRVLLKESNGEYYSYFYSNDLDLFYNSSLNLLESDKNNDIYANISTDVYTVIIIAKYDLSTSTWKYYDKEVIQGNEDMEKYIYCHKDFIWYGETITNEADNDLSLTSKSVTFNNEATEDKLKDYTTTDEEGNEVTYKFVNGKKIAGEDNSFFQLLDDPNNYFIMVTNGLGNIKDPTANKGIASVGDNRTVSFTLYTPMYDGVEKVLTGVVQSGGVVANILSKTQIYKSSDDWFSGNDINDQASPIIDTIYAVNGRLKMITEDPTEYQLDCYNNIYYFIEDNGKCYEKIPWKYYNTLDSSITLQKNGAYYICRDGEFEISDEIDPISKAHYVLKLETEEDDSGNSTVLSKEKFERREIIDAQTSVMYVPSGVANIYAVVTDKMTYFDEEVKTIVDGVEKTYAAGEVIPVNTTLIFDASSLSLPLPVENHSLTFYLVDGFGNISESIIVKDISITSSNNSIIYGDGNDDVKQEIEDAKNSISEDNLPPEILYVYIYKGKLKIAMKDVAQEGVTPVGFKSGLWSSYIQYSYVENPTHKLLDSIICYTQDSLIREISTEKEEYLNLTLGDLVIGSSKQWQTNIGDGLKIFQDSTSYNLLKDSNGKIETGKINIAARDANLNETADGDILSLEVSEDLNNSILYGAKNVPSEIISMLEDAKNGNDDDDDDLNSAPVIESIYMLNGILYVVATDDKGIDSYGFQWKYNSLMVGDFVGRVVKYDENGVQISDENNVQVLDGSTISSKTTLYRAENYMSIKIPNAMTIYVTDTDGNVTKRNVYPTSANQVLFGNVSDTVKDLITDNGGTINPPEENSYPVITSVYTYQGYLYVEGYANDGFHAYPYGFRVDEDSIYPGQFAGYDELDKYINITAQRLISKGTKIYKDINYQRISFPTSITVFLRDCNLDETSMSFTIDKDNSLYYGKDPNLPDGPLDDNTGGDSGNDSDNNGGNNSGDNSGNNGGDSKPSGDNTKPGTDNTPGVIVPDDGIKDIDWNEYDYVLELLDYNTERVVYKIRKDSAVQIEIPRLQDSTTYIYKQIVIKESDESIYKTITGEYSTEDTIAPVISKIWFTNNRLFVSAYDAGGLADEPYLFAIQGTPNTNTKYSSYNNIRAVYGDEVAITVMDKAGNTTTVTITINKTTKNTLYECVNPTSPVFVRSGTSKSVSYWLAYLGSKYNVDTSKLTINAANCSNISFTEENNEVVFNFDNDGVLTYYDKNSNMYYSLYLQALNAGKTYRSIIIEKGSEVDFALAFERKLKDLFGTTDGITWAVDDSKVVERDSARILANNEGVALLVASKDGVKENFYIVVGDTISGVKSSCDFKKENIAYTYLVNSEISLVDALSIPESEAKYIVLDSATDGLSKKDVSTLKTSSTGRKNMMLLDVVNDEIFEYTFEVVNVVPFISTFTDIIGSNNRADIEYLCERGVISQYPDYKYKTSNKMTTKEFLTMLNRIRLTYDSDFVLNKQTKEINLDDRDFDYYSSMNILSNLTQEETNEMLSSYTLNKAVTFEEVISLISKTLLYDEQHTQTGITVPDGLSNVSDVAKHLISIGIISEDDARNGSKEVTKSEIAYMLAQTIRFLEY